MSDALSCTRISAFDAILNRVLDRLPPAKADLPEFLARLHRRDRHLLVLVNLNSQVCNGGFAQWVDTGTAAQEGEFVLLALERMRQETRGVFRAHVEKVQDLVQLVMNHAANAENPEQLTQEEFEYLDRLDHGYLVLCDEYWPMAEAYFVGWPTCMAS